MVLLVSSPHPSPSCGVVWYEGLVTLGCKECGGYAMTRQCPICKGVCGKQWKRVLDLVSQSSCDDVNQYMSSVVYIMVYREYT